MNPDRNDADRYPSSKTLSAAASRDSSAVLSSAAEEGDNSEVDHSSLVKGLQDFIDDVNVKRQWEFEVLAKFKEMSFSETDRVLNDLDMGARALCQRHSDIINTLMDRLYATLQDIKNLEEELTTFRCSLGQLHQRVNRAPVPPNSSDMENAQQE